jgi:hypothetical protein
MKTSKQNQLLSRWNKQNENKKITPITSKYEALQGLWSSKLNTLFSYHCFFILFWKQTLNMSGWCPWCMNNMLPNLCLTRKYYSCQVWTSNIAEAGKQSHWDLVVSEKTPNTVPHDGYVTLLSLVVTYTYKQSHAPLFPHIYKKIQVQWIRYPNQSTTNALLDLYVLERTHVAKWHPRTKLKWKQHASRHSTLGIHHTATHGGNQHIPPITRSLGPALVRKTNVVEKKVPTFA